MLTDRQLQELSNEIAAAIQMGLGGVADSLSGCHPDTGQLIGVDGAIQLVGRRIAKAITADAGLGRDAAGGSVGSLTEAVMGMTAGLVQIATAIDRLAGAVEARNGHQE